MDRVNDQHKTDNVQMLQAEDKWMKIRLLTSGIYLALNKMSVDSNEIWKTDLLPRNSTKNNVFRKNIIKHV